MTHRGRRWTRVLKRITIIGKRALLAKCKTPRWMKEDGHGGGEQKMKKYSALAFELRQRSPSSSWRCAKLLSRNLEHAISCIGNAFHANMTVSCLSDQRNASFLFTAKKASDHSCRMLDSVLPLTPGGGGNDPSGLNWKSSSMYSQLHTS